MNAETILVVALLLLNVIVVCFVGAVAFEFIGPLAR